jgi:hypothetical protein
LRGGEEKGEKKKKGEKREKGGSFYYCFVG